MLYTGYAVEVRDYSNGGWSLMVVHDDEGDAMVYAEQTRKEGRWEGEDVRVRSVPLVINLPHWKERR